MNRDEVIHKELITDACNVKTMDEAVALVRRLELTRRNMPVCWTSNGRT